MRLRPYLLSFLIILFPQLLQAEQGQPMDAAELKLALNKLTTLGSVLYIAAHPDDENNSLLAWLANEKRLRTGYLALTRGDGGQNLIGPEKGALIGIIRTQELLAAQRAYGVEQYFTRAMDFGYSKSAQETFSVWDRETLLSDVVWVIRSFQPDVIIMRFPTTGEGRHGQHTASALLAREAFDAAADPARFPEQLQHTTPWQAQRLFLDVWPQLLVKRGIDSTSVPVVDLGAYNSLLGKSYTELGAEARSLHKSQGEGTSRSRSSKPNYFQLLAGSEPEGPDLFAGIETGWARIPGSQHVAEILARASEHFIPDKRYTILPLLLQAEAVLETMPASVWVGQKRKELRRLIRECAGLWLEATSDDFLAAPGDEIILTINAVNRSPLPMALRSVRIKSLKAHIDERNELQQGQLVRREMQLRLPVNQPFSQPYWLQKEPRNSFYVIDSVAWRGQAENPPALTAEFEIEIAGQSVRFSEPVLFRWQDAKDGDRYRRLEIGPPVAVQLDQSLLVFADARPRHVRATVVANARSVSGEVRLALPAGWHVEPGSAPFALSKRHQEAHFTFTITPPQKPGTGYLRAIAATGGREYSLSRREISYPHIPIQLLHVPAKARLLRLDLKRGEEKIGYIMGSGDEIPQSLQQLGYEVTLLTDEMLDNDDLQAFDVIIAGIRAYNVRPRLAHQQQRLMDFVKNGGTYIVQYSKHYNLVTPDIGPWPLQITWQRITVEQAPMRFLLPGHSVLNQPNKITGKDFQGWVQERGLYFAGEWDDRYEAILAGHDPGEPDRKGGLLFTRYGKGVFIYTGLSWFRQLPAGVPGAYRLFVNLISAR